MSDLNILDDDEDGVAPPIEQPTSTNSDIDESLVISRINSLMSQLKQSQQLQKLSAEKGLDIKNGIDLTDDTIDNMIVSITSLLIAKLTDDPRYKSLVLMGTNKRSLKVSIINDYKNRANQMLQQYKNTVNV